MRVVRLNQHKAFSKAVANGEERAEMTEGLDLNRALVVAAHPDDPEFGCAGTVAQWVEEGKEVFYLVCSRGNRGSADPDMTEERLAAMREQEQREAATLLGIREVEFLDQSDGELENTLAFRGLVVRAIRKYKPDIVLTHDPTTFFYRDVFINHPDHRATGLVTVDAIYPTARERLQFPEHLEQGLEPHKVKEIYFFGTNEPNFWVDIEAKIEIKIQALRRHKSQFGDFEELEDMVRTMAENSGQDGDPQYAEGFKRIAMAF
jgi:LmbE family N-acetylglucosaminyl deacetylase